MARHPGLFDVDERLQRLSDIGDQLEAYSAVVDFEMFRTELETALNYGDGARGRLRHIAGTQWSTRKYMNMDPLHAAKNDHHGAVVA